MYVLPAKSTTLQRHLHLCSPCLLPTHTRQTAHLIVYLVTAVCPLYFWKPPCPQRDANGSTNLSDRFENRTGPRVAQGRHVPVVSSCGPKGLDRCRARPSHLTYDHCDRSLVKFFTIAFFNVPPFPSNVNPFCNHPSRGSTQNRTNFAFGFYELSSSSKSVSRCHFFYPAVSRRCLGGVRAVYGTGFAPRQWWKNYEIVAHTQMP